MGPPETGAMTDTKLKRIAWLSASDPHRRFDRLMHHFKVESLAAVLLRAGGDEGRGHRRDRIKRREWFCPEPIARIGHDGF